VSRTYRKDAKKRKQIKDGEVHSLYYRREVGSARKLSRQKFRAKSKQALRNGEEELPTFKGTQGWESH
jgi:hypothetical protein